ncbi:MAG: S1 RNA-binding domain-containing protein [Candidatus Jorgensenbacteria bacterium]|nr:S1 RNA-binding domain-containing protein [Candidatus Jorgensenbacteria bacterium]
MLDFSERFNVRYTSVIMNSVKPNLSRFAELVKAEPTAFGILKIGDLVEGALLEKSARRLLVDLGRHGVGVVYRGELMGVRGAVKDLKPGDTLHAKVVALDNEEGYVELSIAEAGRQKAWVAVTELKEKGEPLTVKVTGANKGGLTSELEGLPAFIPVSQLAGEHYPRVVSEDKSEIGKALQALVGVELTVKIIDANSRTGKLILSEREASEVSTRELVKNYTEGQIVEGIVSGIADFGVFVRFTDNPAVEGLIHVSELDHRMVENPKEVVKVDEAVKAKIVEIKDGKISLSLKDLKVDPWETAAERYQAGMEVKGVVYSTNPFGALVNFDDLQGQVHVTEFGGADEMKKHLAVGKTYPFVVQDVKPAERRVLLKLKK